MVLGDTVSNLFCEVLMCELLKKNEEKFRYKRLFICHRLHLTGWTSKHAVHTSLLIGFELKSYWIQPSQTSLSLSVGGGA